MKERYSVIPRTLCFIFHADEVLFIKGSDNKDWSGKYNALGGHLEKREGIVASANREIKEECGLELTDTKLRGIIHACDFFGKNVMVFVTSSTSITKKVVADHNEGILEWKKVSELDTLNIFEDVKPILKQMVSMKSNEMFLALSQFDGKGKLLSFDIKTY
jgi:8-oxo-dGTP diphosphatase